MNQNVSGRRWRWRAAHCGSDTHVRGRGCWGSSVTPHLDDVDLVWPQRNRPPPQGYGEAFERGGGEPPVLDGE